MMDFYLPSPEMWIYKIETGEWQKTVVTGDCPLPMSGSCAVCVSGKLYMFGGHHSGGNSNEIYMINLERGIEELRWVKLSHTSGQPPTSKDKLGCWVYQGRLILFGGYGYPPQEHHRGNFEFDEASLWPANIPRGWNNHVHVFDPQTQHWSQPVTTGNAPVPRAAHACTTLGNRGYVFGGRFLNSRMDDLHSLNLDTWEWSGKIVVHGVTPIGRSWHSLTAVSSSHLFLYGGFTTDREPLGDGWIFSIRERQWIRITHVPENMPRLWHSACLSEEGEVIIFGGCSNNILAGEFSGHSNDVIIFSIQPKSLIRLCLDAVAYNKELLGKQWDCLPQTLVSRIRRHVASNLSGS
uniref:Kelch domain containing 2 n=1 Tax=Eptatretus burgeri TaxID=7764 RepID=A0A8C4R7K4_EPTBU